MIGIILHLSDLHLFTGKEPVLTRCPQIAAAAIGQCPEVDFIVILISGDITQSGNKKEFAIADSFLALLKESINALLPEEKRSKLHFITVPGNHDCDFSTDTALRKSAIDSLKSTREYDKSLFDEAIKVNDGYYKFMSEKMGITIVGKGKIVSQVKIELNDQEVIFHCINSAWTSQKKQNPGALWLPINEIENSMEQESKNVKEGKYRTFITVLHHPYNWFIPEIGRSLRRKLEQRSDIIITGHEHDHETYVRVSEDRTSTTYIEGDVLSDRNDSEISGFNLVILNLQERKRRSINFQWQSISGVYEVNTSEQPSWYLFNRMTDSIISKYRLSDEWSQKLDDAEIGFKHPRVKGHLRLEQIYIYPELATRKPGKTDEELVKSNSVINYFIQNKLVALIGPKGSGKTAMCKTLYKDLISQGIFPLLFSGSLLDVIKQNYIDYIKSISAKAYSNQYNRKKEPYWSIPFNSRAIIVDDFVLNSERKEQAESIIKSLKELFDHIIITGPSDLLIGDLIQDGNAETIISSFNRANIKHFGHLMRGRLVELWYKIGLTNEDNLDLVAERAHDASKLITQVMSRALIPPYPMYIIMILQAIQAGGFDPVGEVTYGPLYTQLIMDDLRDVYKGASEIDAIISFLSMVAIRLQKSNQESLSADEFNKCISEYNKLYNDELISEHTKTELSKTGIIKVSEFSEVGFYYQYYRFYFVAHFLWKNIQEDEARQIIKGMAEDLFNEENGNTILFLSSMSNDKFIVESILSVSEKIFPDSQRYDFSNKEMLPKTYTPSESGRFLVDPQAHKTHRERHHAQQDEMDEIHQKNQITPQQVNEVIKQFNASFKTVQIIGQILSHSSGSIKSNEKERIAKSGYDLSLRTLTTFYKLLNDKMNDIGNRLSAAFIALGYKGSEEERKRLVNRVIGSVIESFAFGVICHSSECFGHNKLSVTLENLYPELNRTCADDLLILAIKIEKKRPFPKEMAVSMYEKHKGNPFATEIIRTIIQQHFYLHEVPIGIIQSVCSRVGIEVQDVSKYLNRNSKIAAR